MNLTSANSSKTWRPGWQHAGSTSQPCPPSSKLGGKGKGIGGHQRAYTGQTVEWLTPPDILKALGPFDLDPCAPIKRPWDMAAKHYTVQDNGLALPWGDTRVWLNPPYGPHTHAWLERMAKHGNGIALIFARTETEMFFGTVWDKASALLFLRGRLHFHHLDGKRAKANAGGPSVLISYDRDEPANATRLKTCGLAGAYINMRVQRSEI